jgi:hypothetical protein
MLNRRLRALVAAGVIALSGGATATSVASEADDQEEGVSTQPALPIDEVDGEVETPLPVEVDPDLVLGDPDQDATTELPEGAEPSAPIPLEVVAPDATGPGGEPDGDSGGELNPLPAEPPASPAPPAPAPAPDGDAGDPSGTALLVEDGSDIATTPRLRANRGNQERQPAGAGSRPPASDVAPQPQPAAESAPAPETRSAESLAAGGRFHIVQPGESLWSIAADLLNPGASAAAITLQVQRLWELNKDRIGTGDPDTLPIGVKLRVR